MTTLRRLARPILMGFLLIDLVLASCPQPARAESDVVLSLDRSRVLVNKTVGSERWLITYDLAVGNVTGNVLRDDGSVAFLDCAPVSASVSAMKFACYSAPACAAYPCSGDVWAYVADVELPRDFFALSDQPLVGGCIDVSGSWTYVLRRPGVSATPITRVDITQTGCGFEIRHPDGGRLVTGFVVADTAQIALEVSPFGIPCPTTGRVQFLATRGAGGVESACDGSVLGVLLIKHPAS